MFVRANHDADRDVDSESANEQNDEDQASEGTNDTSHSDTSPQLSSLKTPALDALVQSLIQASHQADKGIGKKWIELIRGYLKVKVHGKLPRNAGASTHRPCFPVWL